MGMSGRNKDRSRVHTVTAQPQQRETEQWDEDVDPEDDADIARREIMRRDHLIHMTGRRAEREDAGAKNGCEAQIRTPKRREKSDRSEAEAAIPTSTWNGLSAQPMKPADNWPKKTCMTKL